MKILIIEDEPYAQKELIRLLNELDSEIDILNCIDSVSESVNWLKNNQADLIFMDIQLSDGLSFEIFEKIEVKSPVIFTTAYDNYAIKAFKVNSIDYLLKPIEMEDLHQAIQKYKSISKEKAKKLNIDNEHIEQLLSVYKPQSYKSRFVAKIGDNIVHIAVEDIPYFYFEEKVVFLVNKENRRYIVDYTLEQLESLLDPKYFFRINRKYIVSIQAIHKVSKYFNSRLKVYLKPHIEDEILISRAKVKDFMDWLNA